MDEIEIKGLSDKKPETRSIAGQAVSGLKESIPFVSPEKAEGPAPRTFGEKFTRRFARNLPLDVGIGAFGGPAGALLGTGAAATSALAGTAAEQLGVGKTGQTAAEIVGGFAPGVARTVVGKTAGFIEPQLEELYKKGKQYFELGPGARTQKGMAYGTGETEEAAIRNLNKYTKEATKRAGNETQNITNEWVKQTGDKLIGDVNKIFAGKTFSATPKFEKELETIANKAEGAFGEQGNVVKNILENNIKGDRPRGALIGTRFAAEDLRNAIIEVNGKLDGATGNQARLLHDLKDSLENLAESNLSGAAKDAYKTWKSQYASFATIRDTLQREGSIGISRAGQINPEKLLDVITSRTGGYGTRNPLYDSLGEFGSILKSKTFGDKGALKALTEYFTESPLSKGLKAFIQPKVMSKAGERAARVVPFTPAILQSTTRDTSEKPTEIDIYGGKK